VTGHRWGWQQWPKYQHKLRRCNYQSHMYWHPDDHKCRTAFLKWVGDCRCYDCSQVVETETGQMALPGLEL
jgi:hypothetical protein